MGTSFWWIYLPIPKPTKWSSSVVSGQARRHMNWFAVRCGHCMHDLPSPGFLIMPHIWPCCHSPFSSLVSRIHPLGMRRHVARLCLSCGSGRIRLIPFHSNPTKTWFLAVWLTVIFAQIYAFPLPAINLHCLICTIPKKMNTTTAELHAPRNKKFVESKTSLSISIKSL